MENKRKEMIITRIRNLRNIWRLRLKENACALDCEKAEASYTYYLEGLSDTLGIIEASVLINEAREVK